MPIYNRLTDRSKVSAVTLNDIFHIVVTGDTSQSPQGSSYFAPLSDLQAILSGASGTSGTNGTSGSSGMSGSSGINGTSGTSGTNGTSGSSGMSGSSGINGTSGSSGSSGTSGTNGSSGSSGTSGTSGTNGTNGTSGTAGTSGSSPSVLGSDNQVLTSNGLGGITSESNLTFSGSQLSVTGTVVTFGVSLPNINTSIGVLTTSTPMLTVTSVDWGNRITYAANNTQSIDWQNRYLTDTNTINSVDWETKYLNAYDLTISASTLSVDWDDRFLYDTAANKSLGWSARQLYTANGTNIGLEWYDNTILISEVYQRDYKTAATQDAVSTNYNNSTLSYLGDVIEVDGSTTAIADSVTNGMLVYLDTNTTWYPVNQADSGSTNLIGIAHNVGFGGGGTGYVLLEGHVVIDDTSFSGPNVQGADHGLPIYIRDSTTQGLMSTTVPFTTSGNNVVRVLGHCYQQNSSTTTQWMMKFRPSNDWIEI